MKGSSKIGLLLVGMMALVASSDAAAQFATPYNYCDRLQAEYRSAVQQAGGGADNRQHVLQTDQISRNLVQAERAAQQYGCNGGGFLSRLFGPQQSPQCPAIMADINRFRQQLGRLRGGNGFGSFNSPDLEVARLRDELNRNSCGIPVVGSSGWGGYRTLCVRVCDGYYFPIEFSAVPGRFQVDARVCQSMYSSDGEAELFVQPSAGDIAEATSLTGQRYGDQPFAFNYRQIYSPACSTQLHEGIAALGQRYLSQVPAMGKVAASVRQPIPIPRMRPPASEDPETLANLAGRFTIRPVTPTTAMADAPTKGVRFVGPPYYAKLFDVTQPPKRKAPEPGFSLIGPAAAEESEPTQQQTSQ